MLDVNITLNNSENKCKLNHPAFAHNAAKCKIQTQKLKIKKKYFSDLKRCTEYDFKLIRFDLALDFTPRVLNLDKNRQHCTKVIPSRRRLGFLESKRSEKSNWSDSLVLSRTSARIWWTRWFSSENFSESTSLEAKWTRYSF